MASKANKEQNRQQQAFLKLLMKEQDDASAQALFELFFTKEEQRAIQHRYLIIKELLAGEKSQRQIASDLNVSIAKITRGSNSLKEIDPKLKNITEETL